MAVISIDQAARDAYQAGWRGVDWVAVVALSIAEAAHVGLPGGGWGLDTNSANQGHYGVLQFAPSTITGLGFAAQDAFDPVKSYAAALKVYQQGGSHFGTLVSQTGPWYASAGTYTQWLTLAADSINHVAGSLGGSNPVGGGPLAPWDPSSPLNPGNIAGGWLGDAQSLVGGIGRAVLPHVVILGGLAVVAVFLLLEVRGEATRKVVGASG